MKKIILITFIIFFINNALAKVEKTTFGIDMDIPNDYVLIKKENYEQLKKIAEFSTSSQSNILKPVRENNRSDVDQLIASGTKDKSYLMIIPIPPERFQTHMISFTNMGSDNPTSALLNEYKSNIKKLCDDWFKEIKSEPIYQNLKISEIAIIVKNIVERDYPNSSDIRIVTTSSNDSRSYHINSDKIKKSLGFVPKFSVEDAVKDLCYAYKSKLILNTSSDIYYNMLRLKNLQIK